MMLLCSTDLKKKKTTVVYLATIDVIEFVLEIMIEYVTNRDPRYTS